MPESDSKGFWGAVTEIVTFPFAVLLGGFFAAIWGASNGFHYKEIDLAAGDAWRLYVMCGGVVAMLGAVALYLFDKREDVPKAPLPYRIRRKHPYTIYEPADRREIEVKGKDQKFSIVITGDKGPPRDTVLRVMWRGGDKLFPLGDIGAEDPNLPGFAWRFTGYCPSPDKLKNDEDDRQYALYYVGKNAEPLVKYRDVLCKYFAKEGVPNWPELPDRNDIVRCSSIRTIIFKLPKAAEEYGGYRSGNPNPIRSGRGGLGPQSGTGLDEPGTIPGRTPLPGTDARTSGSGQGSPRPGGDEFLRRGTPRPGGNSTGRGGLEDEEPRNKRPGT